MRQILLLSALLLSFFPLFGQDNCSSAVTLCAGSSITRSTAAATVQGSDPSLSCGDATLNNNVWFKVTAIANGTCTVTVTRIDNNPGLDMEVYTGACGSLVTTGFCASGSSATGGNMSVIFPVTNGTTYFIMVDGSNGNQEPFDIAATTVNNSIVARPDANFSTDPSYGCIPLNVLLDNTSTIYGGTNMNYNWQIDGGAFIPSNGNDTTVVFNSIGTHTIVLRVCNNECGCKSVSQDVISQTLVPTISVNPSSGGCVGETINFDGDATIQPDPPFVDPNVTTWTWDFGDPGSGANNSATGQNVTHVFSGPGTSYTVTLTVDGTCGPTTASAVVNLLAQPTVTVTGPDSVCEGVPFDLTAEVIGNPNNYSYDWFDPTYFSCSSCQTSALFNLTAGGPFTFTVTITDANGCTASANKDVTINEIPTVTTNGLQIVCPADPAVLNTNTSGGIAPYSYQWSPLAGLDYDTVPAPTTYNTNGTFYCVTVTDAAGCQSNPDCVFLNQYPVPVINSALATLCASSSNLQNTFTVVGASPGSSYSWILSPDYSVITSAAPDSSDITVDFPQGVATTYNFTVVVTDVITGCIDTVTTSFTVTNGINVTISGPTSVCEGIPFDLTANVPGDPNIYTYDWSDPTYFACSTCQTSTLFNLTAGGPYTFTLIVVDTSGCDATTTIDVTINEVPIVFTAGNITVCPGQPAVLSTIVSGGVAPYSYQWSPTAGLDSDTIDSPTTYNTNGTTYCVDITDAVGCQATTACVSINEYTRPDISAAVPSICATSSNLQNTFTVNGAGAGSTYIWGLSSDYGLITNAAVDSSDITVDFPFGVGATYNFTVIVTDGATGCIDTISTSFDVTTGVPVTISGPSAVCEGLPFALTANVPGDPTQYTYDWTDPAYFACSTCQTSTLFNLTAGGPYTFTITVNDTNGCASIATFDVTINEIPLIYTAGSLTVCPSDPALLSTVTSGGLPPYTYQWTPSTGLSSDTIDSPLAYDTNGSNYCVTVTDAAGCQSNPSCVTINQYPMPVITPSVPIICASSTNRQNTFTVSRANSGSSYSWGLSPDYGWIISASPDSSDITVDFPSGVSATYNFTVIVSDAVTSCVDTINYSFDVISGLNMVVSGPAQMCAGDSVTLTVNGANTYAWMANPSYTFTDSTLASQTVSPLVATQFTIQGTAGTCTQTINYILTVNAKPTAIVASIAPFCSCSTVSLDASASTPGMNYLWTSAIGSPIADSSSSLTTAQVCANDTFFLRVTDPATGCFADTFTLATSLPKPSAVATVNPDQICNGTSTVINLDGTGSDTNAGTTYHWVSSNPGFVISDTTALVTTALADGPVVFTLTVTDAFGCDSTASDTVTVFPVPTISVSPGLFCTNDPVRTSFFTVSGASAGSVYDWNIIPGCVSPSSANTDTVTFDFSTCSVGTYNFNVTVIDAVTSCLTNLPSSVTLIDQVVLTTSNDTTFCEGGVATLAVSGANTYLWTGGQTTDTIVVSGLTASPTPYEFVVSGFVGSCQASDTIRVTVNPVPAVSVISGPITACLNDTDSYSIDPVVGTITWIVSGGTILSGQGTTSVSVAWSTAGSGSLSVNAVNSFNCSGTAQSITVNVSPRPGALTVNGPVSVCQGTSGSYFVNATAGSTYQWSVSGGTVNGSSTDTIVNIDWGTTGSGSVFVIETNAAGCSGAITTYSVTIRPKPTAPVVSGGQLVCDNVPVDYSIVPNGGSTYIWSTVNAQFDTLNPTSDTLFVTWGNAGNGQVLVTETNSFGCTSDTTVVNVIAILHPIAQVVTDSVSMCNNTSVQLDGIANTPTIAWYTDGNGTFDDATIANPTYTASQLDTGYIHLTMVIQNFPCTDDSVTVSVYHSASPTLNLAASTTSLCQGDTAILVASVSTNYLWSPGGEITDTIRVNPSSATTYSVSTVNGFGCSSVDSVRINVLPPGIPDAGSNQVICITDTVQLAGTQQNAGGVIWSTLGDGSFLPNANDPNAQYVPGANDTTARQAILILTTTGACRNLTDTITVDIEGIPTLEAGNDTLISTGPSSNAMVVLNPSGTNLTSIHWTSTGSGSFSPSDTSLNPVYIPSAADYSSGHIYIVAVTTGACNPVTDSLKVDFSTFQVPNVFTPYPASPGQNDFFVIPNLPPNSRLQVWDRWGMLVYTSDNYQNNWDGFGLESDTYYYVLDTTDKSYKGWVTMIRD